MRRESMIFSVLGRFMSHRTKKTSAREKELCASRSKTKVRVVGVRPMTNDEENRFTAAVDALLSEIIRQELGRTGGVEYGRSEELLEG
jgi:hypothetical protein